MSIPSTGPVSFSQLRSALGGSGTVSYSSYAPLAGLSKNNVALSQFHGQVKAQSAGLMYRTFSGYFGSTTGGADDTTWFDRQTETNSGLVSNFTSLNSSSAGLYTAQSGATLFSIEWFGYFFAPTTGTYTFTTNSDDASYLWIGSSALVGYTPSNATVSNGEPHPVQAISGTVSLTAGTYYPIRVQYGQNMSGYDFYMSFSGPSITTISDFTGYVFFGLGSNSSFPANAARLIRSVTGTNTDGMYYINVNGTSTQTYCLMNSAWNGGGWMMALKMARGTTFPFSSTYWTDSSTTLNSSDMTRNTADAKYNIMNYGMMKDILAVWTDTGYKGGSIASPPETSWTWEVDNYYSSGTRTTILTGLSSANSRTVANDASGNGPSESSSSFTFSGWNANIWSTEGGIAAHVMGGGSHLPSNSGAYARWGFIFNNETNWQSIDVFGGIGMGFNGTWTYNVSAGDYIGCCANTSGLNRTMAVHLFGR